MNPLITLPELADLTSTGVPVQVLDVRLAEDFASGHLPDSVHHCVFEVGFLAAVQATLPQRQQRLIVVGWGSSSQEAEVAWERLVAAGYVQAQILQGGIDAWSQAGLTLDATAPALPVQAWPVGRRALDLAQSSVAWCGRNLLNQHRGLLPISSGYLDFDAAGPLVGGRVECALRDLICTDLAGTPLHEVLVQHLLSADFFAAERFPLVVLEITQSTRIAESAGSLNLEVRADLTLRGVTQGICFLASAGLTPEGQPAAQAALAIDRTRWGAIYGSGKLFRRLAGHLVNDRIELHAKLVVTAG